jgi:hypothetical protein
MLSLSLSLSLSEACLTQWFECDCSIITLVPKCNIEAQICEEDAGIKKSLDWKCIPGYCYRSKLAFLLHYTNKYSRIDPTWYFEDITTTTTTTTSTTTTTTTTTDNKESSSSSSSGGGGGGGGEADSQSC